MKKKWIIVSCFVVFAMALLLIFKPWGTKPFRNLSVSEVQEITVRLTPPEITFAVNDEELIRIVEALNSIVLYRQNNSNEPLAGQDIVFTITKTDGTVISVRPLGNLIKIDGLCYYTNNELSAQLTYFANNLESAKDG